MTQTPQTKGFIEPGKNSKGLIMGHLNVRSIKRGTKLDELRTKLKQRPV